MPSYAQYAFSFVMLIWATSIAAKQVTDSVAPEQSTGIQHKAIITAKEWMVTAANPLATQAGADVLTKGGNAIDAMVATQLMLGLVEPQSSGIGGGAFLLYWDAKTKQLTSFDGRETAPMQANEKLFLNRDGEPMSFYDAVVGGRSVATPGTVMLLWQVHKKYGKLAWKTLFASTIETAQKGFAVSPRLAALIKHDQQRLSRYPATKQYFFDDLGQPKLAGSLLKNPAYAKTLQAIANIGARAFYHGDIARNIVDVVQKAKGNPGTLGVTDLERYQIKQRSPVCLAYASYQVCGMGPPSSGALTLGQILSITGQFDLKSWGPDDPRSWQVIADASRLAFADRGLYMADEDFVTMPTQGLLDPHYLRQRAKLITPNQALKTALPGQPPWKKTQKLSQDEAIELPSTTHFNIVDKQGNVVSMTSTIENAFGSRLMVDGFLLNNELTDFSFRSQRDGKPIANRLQAGKRPRSSMTPTIILKNGTPYLAIGSPGGSRIIGYVAQAIIAHLQWGMDIQNAINLPHILSRFNKVEIEAGTSAERFTQPLEKMGYMVDVTTLNSGLHGILIKKGQLYGAADPRREGTAVGQ